MNSIKRDSSMVIILWGLLISKCLTLEYLIQVYSVPINSLFYIWTLTLSMAITATIVFFQTENVKHHFLEKISIIHLCWLGCTIASLLLIGAFFLSSWLESQILLAILSIILGIGYLVHGISIVKSAHILSGIGWWTGAAILATRSGLESLAIVAFLIILLTTLPLIIGMRQQETGFI